MTPYFDGLELLLPLAIVVLGGIGFLLRRRLTGQAEIEDQESLVRTVKLQQLLDQQGLSLEEAKALREQFRQGRGGITQAEANVIAQKVAQAEEREAEHVRHEPPGGAFDETTVGMRFKASAELEGVEEALAYAIEQFREECSADRSESLKKAQEAWETYRNADAELASLLFEGGSLAPLAFTRHQIELTEQRIREIRLMMADTNL